VKIGKIEVEQPPELRERLGIVVDVDVDVAVVVDVPAALPADDEDRGRLMTAGVAAGLGNSSARSEQRGDWPESAKSRSSFASQKPRSSERR